MLIIILGVVYGAQPTPLWATVFTAIYLHVIFFLSSKVIGGNTYGALAVIMSFAFFIILVFPSDSGRMALRFLRIGGGLPVSILSKTMIPGGKDIIAQTMDGCMILNAGSHIIIKVIDHPTLASCQEASPSPVKNGEIPKGIEIILGSDVIKLEGL
jgi:hypothetical protein